MEPTRIFVKENLITVIDTTHRELTKRASTYKSSDFINDIERVITRKILGVTISSNLTWNAHVANIVSKAGKRLYLLYQLKRAGIPQGDLLIVF